MKSRRLRGKVPPLFFLLLFLGGMVTTGQRGNASTMAAGESLTAMGCPSAFGEEPKTPDASTWRCTSGWGFCLANQL